MKPGNDFMDSMLHIDENPNEIVWIPRPVKEIEARTGRIYLKILFFSFKWDGTLQLYPELEPKERDVRFQSDFSGQDFGGQIDFTNPDAVDWYKGMVREILQMGVTGIKQIWRKDFLSVSFSRHAGEETS